MRKAPQRRAFVLLPPALAAAPWLAHAQAVEARRYVGLSLIGDKLTIVTYREQTSSRIDQNLRQEVKLKDSTLDRLFAAQLGRALAQAEPGARLSLLAPGQADAYEDQSRWLTGSKVVLPGWLHREVSAEAASHLILLTKHSGVAEMPFSNGTSGGGQLQGLGFYLDGSVEVVSTESGQRRTGFVAPYAYFRMLLVDLKDSTLLRRIDVTAAQPVPAARNAESTDPWSALSQQEKMQLLAQLVVGEMRQRLPKLLARD
jgi:hypothetical protein